MKINEWKGASQGDHKGRGSCVKCVQTIVSRVGSRAELNRSVDWVVNYAGLSGVELTSSEHQFTSSASQLADPDLSSGAVDSGTSTPPKPTASEFTLNTIRGDCPTIRLHFLSRKSLK